MLGSDTAGEVAEVGKAVTRFRVGDRVLGHAVGTDKDSNRAAEGTFQQYTVVLERMASPIPDAMPFEDAAVLPLAVSTAACGLFQTDQLGLRHPSAKAEPTGQTVLVWGGSTSVGSNAIQLARRRRLRGHHHGLATQLRLREVARGRAVLRLQQPERHSGHHRGPRGSHAGRRDRLRYHVRRVVHTDRGRVQERQQVRVHRQPPVSFESLADANRSRFELPRVIARLITSNVALQVQSRRRGVRTKYIFGTTLKANEVAAAIYRDFLPDALADGRYVAAPKPVVVGQGVAAFQQAMDIQRKGVSAAKVVVTLP